MTEDLSENSQSVGTGTPAHYRAGPENGRVRYASPVRQGSSNVRQNSSQSLSPGTMPVDIRIGAANISR